MSDTQLEDLKQFITATVSQSQQYLEKTLDRKWEEKLEAKLDAKLDARLAPFIQEMRAGFASIGDAIASIHNVLANHEQPLVKPGLPPVSNA